MNYNKILARTIQTIMNSPYSDLDQKVRPVYADGTPAHSRFITHHVESWDVGSGEVPITSLRPIAWKSAISEYLWIFQDQSNDLALAREKHRINWWDAWESQKLPNTIGERYGATVKRYDLINKLIHDLKTQPYGRRHIIDLYQYADFEMSDGLHPCMFLHMFSVEGRFLNLMSVQRSSDYLVAGDINKIQAIALLYMIAKATGLIPGNFTWVVNNLHIYDRHFAAAKELISRQKQSGDASMPTLSFDPGSNNFYDFKLEHFSLENYSPIYPQLKLELGE